MPWFTTKGQICQLLVALSALCIATYKAWPDMKANSYFTAGAVLFYVMVTLVLGSMVHLIATSRKTPTQSTPEALNSEISDLKAKLAEKSSAAEKRDAIIEVRNETISELRERLASIKADTPNVQSVLYEQELHHIAFNYLPENPLKHGWTLGDGLSQNATFSKADDGPSERAISIATQGRFAMDYNIVRPNRTNPNVSPTVGDRCKRIIFSAKLQEQSVIYAGVWLYDAAGEPILSK